MYSPVSPASPIIPTAVPSATLELADASTLPPDTGRLALVGMSNMIARFDLAPQDLSLARAGLSARVGQPSPSVSRLFDPARASGEALKASWRAVLDGWEAAGVASLCEGAARYLSPEDRVGAREVYQQSVQDALKCDLPMICGSTRISTLLGLSAPLPVQLRVAVDHAMQVEIEALAAGDDALRTRFEVERWHLLEVLKAPALEALQHPTLRRLFDALHDEGRGRTKKNPAA